MYYVYIISNESDTVLYIGVTNDLKRRLSEHRNATVEGFSKRYKLKKLVYYEEYSQITDAIRREKQLKAWKKEKKQRLIENKNPNRDDWTESFL